MAKTFEEREKNLAPARKKYEDAIVKAEDEYNKSTAKNARETFDKENADALSEWNAAVVAEG